MDNQKTAPIAGQNDSLKTFEELLSMNFTDFVNEITNKFEAYKAREEDEKNLLMHIVQRLETENNKEIENHNKMNEANNLSLGAHEEMKRANNEAMEAHKKFDLANDNAISAHKEMESLNSQTSAFHLGVGALIEKLKNSIKPREVQNDVVQKGGATDLNRKLQFLLQKNFPRENNYYSLLTDNNVMNGGGDYDTMASIFQQNGGGTDMNSTMNSIFNKLESNNQTIKQSLTNQENLLNSLTNSSNFSALNDIINRLQQGGQDEENENLYGGGKKKSKKSKKTIKSHRIKIENTIQEGSATDDEDAETSPLSVLIASKKSQLFSQFVNNILAMLEKKLIKYKNKPIEPTEENAKLIKSYLYHKLSESEAGQNMNSMDKITLLLKKSEDDIISDLEDMPKLKELKEEIEKHRKERESEKSSDNKKSSKKKKNTESDNESD